MLQEICARDEHCMLEAWRVCNEQPSCVRELHKHHHTADRNAAEGTQLQTTEQQATPPGTAAADSLQVCTSSW